MFQKGDRVVHRIHGAATVMGIVQPDSAPKECPYYELDPLTSDTRLLVPVEGTEHILRPPSSPSAVDEAVRIIRQPVTLGADKRERYHHRRMQALQARLQTGQVLMVAEVVHSLMEYREKRGKLTFTDRKVLRRAIAFLASELAVVRDIPFEQAERQLGRLAAA